MPILLPALMAVGSKVEHSARLFQTHTAWQIFWIAATTMTEVMAHAIATKRKSTVSFSAA
jgi:hypothetical protein